MAKFSQGEFRMKEPVKSKRYLVFANSQGTNASRVEFKFPVDNEDSPEDYLSIIGVVYEHPYDVYEDGFDKHLVAQYLVTAVEESKLVGKLLTLVDATFTDKEQRKAFKDMVNTTVYGFNRDNEERVRQTYKGFTEIKE